MSKITTKSSNKRFFTKEESEQAENFLTLMMNKLNNEETDEDEDEIEDLFKNYKNKEILPSQFYFYFPKDVYCNLERNVKNGLKSSFIFKKDFPEREPDHYGSCFCFRVLSKDEKFEEYYQLLQPIDSLLSKYFSRADEEHYEIKYNAKNFTMNIAEVINFLENLGFEYKPNASDSEEFKCLFANYID